MLTGWQSVQYAVEAVTLRKTAERRRLFADPVVVQGKSATANTATKFFRLCAILESLCVSSGLTVRNRGESRQTSESYFGEQKKLLSMPNASKSDLQQFKKDLQSLQGADSKR